MLIGLTGPAGAGKDTVGNWLEAMYAFRCVALADPIRAGLRTMLGLSSSAFEPHRKETPIAWLGRSPRDLMQTLGTEWGRNLVTSDLWLRAAERALAQLDEHQSVVITDIRFEDEAAWLRARGGYLWHIRRDSAPKVRAHVSEHGVALAPDDIVIDNDCTLTCLYEKVARVLEVAHKIYPL